MNKNEVARGVRVKLNDKWEDKCLGDSYLRCESVIFIDGNTIMNDDYKGDFVLIKGGSLVNSGYAYLDQLDLEFPYPKNSKPLYTHDSIDYTPINNPIVNNLSFYEYDKPKEKTAARLKIIQNCGMVEVATANFGFTGITSGLYIEKVWGDSDEVFNDYIAWAKKLKLEKES